MLRATMPPFPHQLSTANEWHTWHLTEVDGGAFRASRRTLVLRDREPRDKRRRAPRREQTTRFHRRVRIHSNGARRPARVPS